MVRFITWIVAVMVTVPIFANVAEAPTKTTLAVAMAAMNEKEAHCLALNLYHEARGETAEGVIAVAHVVLNRVKSKFYPNTICEVVRQGGERRNRCQFSWWCDGRSDAAKDKQAMATMNVIAHAVMRGVIQDPTNGATFYHATYVNPYWAKTMAAQTKIGKHIFYIRG